MIIDDKQHRALTFIRAANLGGHNPTARNVLEWLDRPSPLPGEKGALIRPAVPANPGIPGLAEAAIFGGLGGSARDNIGAFAMASNIFPEMMSATEAIARMNRPLEGFHSVFTSVVSTPSTPGKPALYAPDGPPENTVKQLRRLGWLTKKADKGMSLTPLGLALLRAHEMEVSGNDDLQPLVLDAGDALAWGRLLGAIGEQGECLIIDPYLHAPELMQIVEFTQTARVLVGPNLKPREVIELRVLISTPGYQHVELRQAPKRTIHDRYVIGPDKVHLIGGSMGNIGRTTTTILVPLEQDDIKAAIRSRAEEWWAESNTLEPKSSPDVGLAHDA